MTTRRCRFEKLIPQGGPDIQIRKLATYAYAQNDVRYKMCSLEFAGSRFRNFDPQERNMTLKYSFLSPKSAQKIPDSGRRLFRPIGTVLD